MSEPMPKRVTTAQVAHEQYGLERRGHDAGELTEPAGGEHSRAADDYSTSGLFRDENFGRDSCGDGEGRPVDHSWEGGGSRPPELYRDTAESDFSVRSAAGLEDESPAPLIEDEAEAGEESTRPASLKGPIRRRIVK